jgi:hypothetical protein
MRQRGYLILPRLPHWLPRFLEWGNRVITRNERTFFLLVTWLPHFQLSTIMRVYARPFSLARACGSY